MENQGRGLLGGEPLFSALVEGRLLSLLMTQHLEEKITPRDTVGGFMVDPKTFWDTVGSPLQLFTATWSHTSHWGVEEWTPAYGLGWDPVWGLSLDLTHPL